MRALLVALLVVACSKTPPPVSSGRQPIADGCPPPATVSIYESGKFTTMPVAAATANDGCIGTPKSLAACKQLEANMHCDLAPWFRASDVYCSGAAMRPEMMKPQPAEACGCTCSDDYIKARQAWDKRSQDCANVP